MDFSNPLEIVLTIFLAILSIYIIERIIAKAFKTVIFGFLLFLGIFAYSLHHQETLKKFKKPSMRFTVHDLTDYDSFSTKLNFYKDETIKDFKYDFTQARKNLKNK